MYTLSLSIYRKHHISPDLPLSLNNSPLEMNQVDQVNKIITRVRKQIDPMRMILNTRVHLSAMPFELKWLV